MYLCGVQKNINVLIFTIMEDKDIRTLRDMSRKLEDIRASFYDIDVSEITSLSASEVIKFYALRKAFSSLAHDVCMRSIDSL